VIPHIELESGIRLNIGCGLSPTPGWLNFDNSPSVRMARWPVLSPVLAGLGFLAGPSAKLGAMTELGDIRFANAANRIPCPGSS
jgi:hypothetical protein